MIGKMFIQHRSSLSPESDSLDIQYNKENADTAWKELHGKS